MELLTWSLSILSMLVVLLAGCSSHPHKGSPGLVCTNDFVNTVSCSWTGSWLGPAQDCWIFGEKEIWIRRESKPITQSCRLEQLRDAPPGCSLVFEKKQFNGAEVMPDIRLQCNGTVVDRLKDFKPKNHIRMHPPGAPNVTSNENGTTISWNLQGNVSLYFKSKFVFEVQIKKSSQPWTEAMTFPSAKMELKFDKKGRFTARVRVKPGEREGCSWSSWSPTASWGTDGEERSGWWPMVSGFAIGLCLILTVILTFYKCCKSRKLLKVRPIPNPSEYFHTLNSNHEGDLKKWLNPLSLSESSFTAQTCENISPVEVCGDWDVIPSPSPSAGSTKALLHPQNYPSSGSDTSGIVCSSSAFSTFSNVGYFISGSSGDPAYSHHVAEYFTYRDAFGHLSRGLGHNLSVDCPLVSCPDYESLKREPESPDSGCGLFGEEEGKDYARGVDLKEKGLSDQTIPLFVFPQHLPCPSPPPAPAHPQTSSGGQPAAVAGTAVRGSSTAWLAASAMSRSSSMPVEPSETGYLTLKELQATFSNKSI
ncbi:interleukin-2 receptor subunit beta [Menidia menidia]